ncbi:sensor histidine kinase [Thermoanaerobacterium thermosaccharolyticum]|uniref:Integral membrane sensor signal transduction histidine kinase n=1 Tax=Thermoanaerobacterium thermosaccharolyticum (strain ATCC 7956 / DSM 571 / NCIMB 9385 / NCA 3814 / NCTC 13789 / WDCM 00135 / 2032) TaxID=580327 RepID=D9TMQ6_THETC|nr:sensor histidine kinase [Thermoanaerobacterium thermosaccharolyticum]ADL70107.1 integral membrane sensor signal transduction histidine kinase [Thermoanaerobacterium thermosaccharolyticum DSM 571]KAA5806629.1 sensor histidine kinase [Thermoanaerobacterium thermosaccharolyticum]
MLYKKILLSYILIIVIPLIMVATITGNITSRYINEKAKETSYQTLNQANKNISKMLENMKNALLYVSMNKELQYFLSRSGAETPFNVSREIIAIRNSILLPKIFNENYSSIEIFALHKDQYLTRLEQNDVMSSKVVENKEWYKKTLEINGKLFWYVNNDFGKQMISVSRLVFDVKNFTKPIAVISVDMDMSKIASIISDINLGKSSKIYIIDDKGKLIYSEDNSYLYKYGLKMYGNNSGNSLITVNGNKMMVIYNTLQNGWKLIGMVSLDELNEKARVIRNLIYITALLSLATASLISLYFSHSISYPIIELASEMKKAENGDFNMHIGEKWSGEIGVLYSSFNYMIKKINELIYEVYLSKIKEKDAELKALQAQINPHFLYNTLDSINWIAIEHKIPEISKIVNSLASILRYSINKGNDISTVEKEINHVESYIIIQKIRFKDKFEADFNIDKRILPYKTIKLILQPLVENAVIHGIESYEGKGEILINGYLSEEGNIIFEVINNGNLIDLDLVNDILNTPADDRENYGIKNVNERIKLYYGKQYGLNYQIINGRTIASITIPAVL